MTTSSSLLTSCVALCALGASAARADDAPATDPSSVPAEALRVRVHGNLDATAIASAIAAELGVAARVVDSDAACTAPCASIAVDGQARAAIAVVLADATLQRAIDLPAAPGAAAEVVALVVGNLARDQAGALLADLAPPAAEVAPSLAPVPAFDDTLGEAAPALAPEAPPPAEVAPAVDAVAVVAPAETPGPRPTRFGFGLVPALGIDVAGSRGGVAIDVVLGGRRRLAAFNVAGVGSIVTEDLRGTQIGGAFAAAGRVDGLQVGGAVAAAGGVRGTQIGGAVAAARDLRGTQLAGAVAAARDVRGTQIGGAVVAARDLRGTQIGGAVAAARDVRGTQIGGAVSVARRVDGLQVAGAVNVAGRLDGVQVGVVNIAGSGDGVSLGLVNLVRGGRTEVEATLDHRGLGTAVLRHGSRRWHNVYGVGGLAERTTVDGDVSPQDVWMYGLGMGPSWQRGRTTLDVEAMAWHVVYGGDFDGELDLLNQLRFVVGVPVGPAALVAGGALNVYVTSDQSRDGIAAREAMPMHVPDDGELHVQVWPSAFVGVRL